MYMKAARGDATPTPQWTLNSRSRVITVAHRPPRALSNDEFVHRFRAVVRRLDRHISLMDKDDYELRDDIASVLRTLTAPGKGDDGIRRLISRFSLSQPIRQITAPPKQGPNVQFAIGSLPADDLPGSVRVTVPDGVMHAAALFIRSTDGARTATWEDVVTDYGNTFGAHLSTTVPKLLDEVHYFGLSETDFGAYMLRALGVLTSSACHELLSRLDAKHTHALHDTYMAGTRVYAAVYLSEHGLDDLRVQLSRAQWTKPGPVMTLRNPVGKELVFSVADGGRLHLAVREPSRLMMYSE